jgi:two-component system CheB/CheR fusion protein
LSELIATALRSHVAFDRSNVAIQGPDILMTPPAAATLGMVFYELATNAVKYGALSVPGGRMSVSWQIAGPASANRLVVTWTESGGTPASHSAAPGFGTTFVKRSVEYELQGKAEMEPAADGLRWSLEFPFAQNVQRT